MRRFEFVGGSSAKFWELDVQGKKITVRYGRLGANGQIQTKSFESTEAAQRHADKLAREKMAKGYVECAVH